MKISKIEDLINPIKNSKAKIITKFMLVGDGTWVKDDTDVNSYDNCILLESRGYKNLSIYIVFDNGCDDSDKVILLCDD